MGGYCRGSMPRVVAKRVELQDVTLPGTRFSGSVRFGSPLRRGNRRSRSAWGPMIKSAERERWCGTSRARNLVGVIYPTVNPIACRIPPGTSIFGVIDTSSLLPMPSVPMLGWGLSTTSGNITKVQFTSKKVLSRGIIIHTAHRTAAPLDPIISKIFFFFKKKRSIDVQDNNSAAFSSFLPGGVNECMIYE